MAAPCAKATSPRHGIEFREIPTVRGSMYGGSVTLYHPESYAAILDCVYEMADMVSTANGVSLESAIERSRPLPLPVLRYEGNRV